MSAKKKAKSPDWEVICRDLFNCLRFILENVKDTGVYLSLNKDGTIYEQRAVDQWIADALEKVPGVKVRRDSIGVKNMTRKERAAWDKKRAQETTP